MRIAFVTDSYIPIPTGVAVSIATISKGLEKLGHDLIIIAPDYPGWNMKEKNVMRLPALFSPFSSTIPTKWPVFGFNKNKIASFKLDIVHSHYFFKPFAISESIAKISNSPLFHTFYHNYSDKNMLDYASKCDHVITPSKTSRMILERKLSNKISALPVGIYPKDHTRYPPQALKQRLDIPENRKLLICPLRIDDDANLLFLLKAFKLVWKAVDDVHLLIVGGGDKLKYFYELSSRQSFAKYVTFTGFLPKSRLNKMYGSCDLLVYPKLTDPQPLVILESLASGTPVVTVKGLGAQEFVSDGIDGAVVEANIEQFSDKIIDILKRDNLKLKLSMRARINARRYNATAMTSALVNLYQKELSHLDNINFKK